MAASQSSAASRQSFTLRTPRPTFDPRVTPLKGDLADISLAGAYFAPHYVEPQIFRCVRSRSPVCAEAGNPNKLSELLYGELFAACEVGNDSLWGYSLADGSVGYVQASDVAKHDADDSKQRTVKATFTSEGQKRFPGSRIGPDTEDGPADDSCFVDGADMDPVDFARSALGWPFAEGGRSPEGIDDGGLVQLAYGLSGTSLPHHADLIAERLTTDVAFADARHGDLAFCDERVGIVTGDSTVIVADATAQKVVELPLAEFGRAFCFVKRP